MAKCPAVRKIFYNFCKISVSNRLKVFYLLLELPSDQENENGFAAELLWFGIDILREAVRDSQSRFHPS